MIEVAARLWVGSQADYEALMRSDVQSDRWEFVHACRDPYHRQELGYTGRGAPKDHPEYLFARRDGRIILNLVDAADPKYVSKDLIDAALDFMATAIIAGSKVLCHCNQGRSRSPTIAMLHLARNLPEDFEEAEEAMRGRYSAYDPANGMREFARENWASYRGS